YLMDERWPEFVTYLGSSAASRDALFIPLDGDRWNIDRYRWPTKPFADVHQAVLPTLRRSWESRRLADQGAERQRALLAGAEALARSYAANLNPGMTRLIVAQSLLPFLWRDGHLGGREFSVLMTRMPIRELQRSLDTAFANQPEFATLVDFRA